MDDLDFLDEELDKPSVFFDESKLSAEYLPKNLFFRSDELKILASHFKSIFSDNRLNRRMIISGPVGSGKTSIAKKFSVWVNRKAKKDKLNIKHVYVNCRRNKSQFMVLLSIARSLNSHIPARGYSAEELMEMIVEMLEGRSMVMLLVLDEIDYLPLEESNELLYALSRTTDGIEIVKHNVALIMIAQNNSFLESLDLSTKSSLSPKKLEIMKYTKVQLIKILMERTKECFIQGAVSSESIQLAGEIASIRGDARRALELLWYAGKHADREGSSIVYPDHVRLAKADIEPSILRSTIQDLHEHKLLLLLGIARQLRYTKAAHITTGNAEHAYEIICEEYELASRKHTQVWEYIREFEHRSILEVKDSGTGQRGKTKFISVQDVSAVELEKEVLKCLQQVKSIVIS